MMTGIYIGAKNNTLQKLQIKLDFFLRKGLIILETTMKFVAKIYYPKMLNVIKKHFKNKEKQMKL